MTTTKHRHTTKTSRIQGYTGGVATPGRRQDPRAAGAICEVETCSCGAERRTNKNQGHRETSGWVVSS
jgi:hypothetical protein